MNNLEEQDLKLGDEASSLEEESFAEHKVITVDPGQGPERIDKYITGKFVKVSRNRVQNSIKAGAVTVNGKVIKSNYKVNPLDEIDVVIPRSMNGDTALYADEMELDIRYEDDDVLVLHKPPGLVVHPGVGNPRGTLVNGLVHYFGFNSDLPSLAGNPENRPGLVHRIDKDTSGLMVIAKTEFAMSHLAKQFFDHSIHRRYQAIVWSQPNEEQGEFEAYIGRNPKNHRLQTVFLEEEAGKWSKTHWRLIEGLYYVSLMEFELETGRTHQIRVHAKHLGHPVFSDTSYGGDSIRKGTVYNKYKQFVQNCFKICSRQALHAKELGFVHPTTGEQMMFKSELPAEMTEVLEKWRSYVGTKNS